MRYFIFIVTVFILCYQDLSAQADSGAYLKITYLNSDSGMPIIQHMDIIKETQKKRVEEGEIDTWRFYQVLYSSNASHRYRFVTVEISGHLNGLQSLPFGSAGTAEERGLENVIASAKVHSEIWNTRANVYRESLDSPSRYKNANFMRATPGRLEEYLDLEINIAAPLHQNQANNGRMDGWNFNRLVFPTGTSVAYNFITADFYSELEQIEMGITRDLIEKVHPDMDVNEFEDFADSIRERVWSDLWELLEYVE